MSKKRKIDYIIESSDDERLIFRFYPRQSHCHSFTKEPPKKWSDVYKVYYSYAIIKQWRFNPNDQWESEIVFSEPCDECSVINEIAERCLQLSNGWEDFKTDDGRYISLLNNEVTPLGVGTSWTIFKYVKTGYYKFTLFNYFNEGYRFVIAEEEIKAFGKYLKGCCEYMLVHGESI